MQTEVEHSADVDRILALPIRDWFETAEGRARAEALAAWLTDQLRKPVGCDRCGEMRVHSPLCPYRPHERPPLALRPVQAVLLWEFYQLRGAVGWIPVGGGKSLITFLAALMIAALRPYLFLPANLVADTWTKFELYDKYWKCPKPIPNVLSFNTLTQKKNLRFLFDVDPDCLMGDECDKAKDQGRSTFKRINRYRQEVGARCASMWLSGSGLRLSLQDDAHFAAWALGPKAPVPLHDKTLQDFSLALDEDRKVGQGRIRPGALKLFADQMGVPYADPQFPEMGELARAREGWSKRYAYTPGIIVYDTPECNQPLTIDFVLPPFDQTLEDEFEHFRTTDCTHDSGDGGTLLADPLAKDRYEGQAGWGGHYYWDPPPPSEWRLARYNWNCFVREQIFETARHVDGLDTEMAVAQAFPDNEYLLAWRAIKGSYDPEKHTKTRFFSYSVVQFAAEQALYAERSGSPCIIWAKHEAFCQALAALTGWRFFGEMGERIDQYGRSCPGETVEACLRDYVGRQPPTMILSVDSNMRGRNLQAYCNSLNVGWERAAPRTEQRLGRVHRSGQDRPVHDRVILLSEQTISGFEKTYSEALFVQQTRRLTQKILTAQIKNFEFGHIKTHELPGFDDSSLRYTKPQREE